MEKERALFANLGNSLGQWMDENKWWKDACLDPSKFAGDARNQSADIPTLYHSFEMEPFATWEEKRKFKEDVIVASSLAQVDLDNEHGLFDDLPFDSESIPQ